jgi:hypothetical protein
MSATFRAVERLLILLELASVTVLFVRSHELRYSLLGPFSQANRRRLKPDLLTSLPNATFSPVRQVEDRPIPTMTSQTVATKNVVRGSNPHIKVLINTIV